MKTVQEQLDRLEDEMRKTLNTEAVQHISAYINLIGVRAMASQADSLADIAKYLRKMSEYGLPR